ncbi:hypothetical protein AMTR_s02098p00009190 [Amborella trichopoda]|uniref:Uncharacterized protein n=1 Tax=Amborella trichopoda TaxID=13333 RepID=U5CVY6_AMBTC|nr:hypothetical protein AMTR_s02098p00009190 [Amborella trichopoda]
MLFVEDLVIVKSWSSHPSEQAIVHNIKIPWRMLFARVSFDGLRHRISGHRHRQDSAFAPPLPCAKPLGTTSNNIVEFKELVADIDLAIQLHFLVFTPRF